MAVFFVANLDEIGTIFIGLHYFSKSEFCWENVLKSPSILILQPFEYCDADAERLFFVVVQHAIIN